MSTEVATCREYVGGTWDTHRCGKAIERDGLCKRHAALRDKRNAKDDKRAATRELHDAYAKRLSEKFGTEVAWYQAPGGRVHYYLAGETVSFDSPPETP